ncbi:hypothetical protein MNBD_ALPHA01-1534 [hydrothermal vent metagenome]|uniref:Uncharacterized protein n=1 Tax=hydrothermal vent metagenome TaxID=652676 RepID=A0A3B0SRM1_9ZZZZ
MSDKSRAQEITEQQPASTPATATALNMAIREARAAEATSKYAAAAAVIKTWADQSAKAV